MMRDSFSTVPAHLVAASRTPAHPPYVVCSEQTPTSLIQQISKRTCFADALYCCTPGLRRVVLSTRNRTVGILARHMVGSKSSTGATKIRIEELRRRIGEGDISFAFTRSGGPGGQNVNKVSTRVTLSFDLNGCAAFIQPEKDMIQSRLGNRISKDGVLQVVSSRHRTQAANRAAATERLFELLADALRPRKSRRPTKIPKSAKARRLREKKTKGEQKRLRSRPNQAE